MAKPRAKDVLKAAAAPFRVHRVPLAGVGPGVRAALLLGALAVLTTPAGVGAASVQRADTTTCTAAAQQAAAVHGVPPDILLTIAAIESGRGGDSGWPWTVGRRGQGFWAGTREDAVARARDLIAAGERNLDLGCFQINVQWHAAAFASLEQMFDPAANADYAARLLARHYARTGDWEAAVAAYHSQTPGPAARYLARFRAAWPRIAETAVASRGGPDPSARQTGRVRQQADPAPTLLADAAAPQAAGSLVRAGRLERRLIGGAP